MYNDYLSLQMYKHYQKMLKKGEATTPKEYGIMKQKKGKRGR